MNEEQFIEDKKRVNKLANTISECLTLNQATISDSFNALMSVLINGFIFEKMEHQQFCSFLDEAKLISKNMFEVLENHERKTR